jgi:hypothetical protein
MKRITAKAGAYSDNIDWEAVRKAVREHRGYPVAILDRKGAKGTRVKDDMETQIEKADAEDKVIADKQMAELKAAAAEKESKKQEVYKAKDKKKPAKEGAEVAASEPAKAPASLNQ